MPGGPHITAHDVRLSVLADRVRGLQRKGRAVLSATWSALRGETKRLLLVASGAALLGLAGGVVLRPAPAVSAHAHGACVAMDMASAYGFLDETKRKIVTRALTQQHNSYAPHFSGGYHALTTACADVAKKRWLPRS
jgi:hypothetical protein